VIPKIIPMIRKRHAGLCAKCLEHESKILWKLGAFLAAACG